jgi:hypothetical protein
MKKMLFLSLLILGLVFVTTPVGAFPYDTLLGYADDLGNSNPGTETAWAAGFVGAGIYAFEFIKQEGSGYSFNDQRIVVGYYPGFAWEYAIVKYGRWWALYQDDPSDDNLLTVPKPGDQNYIIEYDKDGSIKWEGFASGVSHVSFFKTTQVPEPTTLLLLGFGLICAAGIRRKLKG